MYYADKICVFVFVTVCIFTTNVNVDYYSTKLINNKKENSIVWEKTDLSQLLTNSSSKASWACLLVSREHRFCLSPGDSYFPGPIDFLVFVILANIPHFWNELEFLVIVTCCSAHLEYSYTKRRLKLFLIFRWVSMMCS